ncbi:ABC transporter substrate-binding protein [Streptomyces sp. SCL15-4]|uniref:ABC transporter substrate-binding protein n=1 Tax=Streptomyces sp. SCL15-4 TaxID=2967221 RepID=UPI002966EB6C|nr:ABC transporter substrate-binding protein [Streptomyces sp. SCL15-4]
MKLWPAGPLYQALLAIAAATAVAFGGYFVYRSWFADNPACATGVSKRGPQNECVGVTDGAFFYNNNKLRKIFDLIRDENSSAEKAAQEQNSSPATIALMIPMTSGNPAEQAEQVEQVKGAYLGQYHANHKAFTQPPIRLLLANPGRGYKQWRVVADQLEKATSDDNLRAVVGINISLPETKAAIGHLTRKNIPVVAGPMTADDIANDKDHLHRYPGLARVAPSNSDQADALAFYSKDIKPAETMVIEDSRDGDNYLESLRKRFEKLAEGAPRAPETFISPPDFNDEGYLANTFDQMVPDICTSPAKTIYFAGRPVQLRQFLFELGERSCNKHYTVITGSHAATLTVDEKFTAHWDALTKSKGITLRYAALAHPDAWGDNSTETTGGSKAAFQELTKQLPKAGAKPSDLVDGRIIVTYDAVVTAVKGIRMNAMDKVKMPSLAQVASSWPRLHGEKRVQGASGWICLDQYGNPYNKAVAIVHLDPRKKTAVFDRIAWPRHRAPDADCSILNEE